MHMMGKVGVWLVVLATIASTLLTSKLIQVRDSYTKKLTAHETALKTLRPKIEEQTAELKELEEERFRSKILWGDYWKDVPTDVTAGGSGTVVINIGTTVGVQQKQVLYGFEMLPDGTSVYRGDFTVQTAREVQAQLVPNWAVRAEDVQTWQPRANWRWRILIPSTFQKVFDQQIDSLRKADDVLAYHKNLLDNERKLETMAQEHLKVREAEMVGGDVLPKDQKLNIEFREGLIAAIEEVEEERNQILLKIDELRRELRKTQHSVDQLQRENLELAKKLPQPENNSFSQKE